MFYLILGRGLHIKMGKRKTEKDYHMLAESRGLKWVGSVLPKGVIVETLWECSKGHKWETTYRSIQQGNGCHVCSGNIQKVEKDYHKLASARGFKWVGKKLPKHTDVSTWWECSRKHKWETTYGSIKQRSGCPMCYGTARKTEKDYYNIGDSVGAVWVGEGLPKNAKDETWWKCLRCGYRWLSKYNYIQQGHGCHVCSKHAKKIKKDYHELAKSRGFKWVGENLPKYTIDSTLWECKKKHRWKTTYRSIQGGSNCRVCKDIINGVRVSKPQRKLNNLLCGSLNYPEGKYRIDVAIMRKSQKIAVEYDCQYWHEGNEEHDVKRDERLIFRGWKILHIKSRNLLPTKKQLKRVINNLLKADNNIVNLYLDDWKKQCR